MAVRLLETMFRGMGWQEHVSGQRAPEVLARRIAGTVRRNSLLRRPLDQGVMEMIEEAGFDSRTTDCLIGITALTISMIVRANLAKEIAQ